MRSRGVPACLTRDAGPERNPARVIDRGGEAHAGSERMRARAQRGPQSLVSHGVGGARVLQRTCLLGRDLGNGLRALGHGMLRKLCRQHKAYGRLHLAGR